MLTGPCLISLSFLSDPPYRHEPHLPLKPTAALSCVLWFGTDPLMHPMLLDARLCLALKLAISTVCFRIHSILSSRCSKSRGEEQRSTQVHTGVTISTCRDKPSVFHTAVQEWKGPHAHGLCWLMADEVHSQLALAFNRQQLTGRRECTGLYTRCLYMRCGPGLHPHCSPGALVPHRIAFHSHNTPGDGRVCVCVCV